jgi:hypothetical protein
MLLLNPTQPNPNLKTQNPKIMNTKSRVHAPDKKKNLFDVLERLCWSDCHKGVNRKWIVQNIAKKYHINHHVNEDLVAIGFLEKRDNLYFHTGLTPSYKLVNQFLTTRRNKNKVVSVKANKEHQKVTIELFESLSSAFQATKEEREFIIALRNLLNLK